MKRIVSLALALALVLTLAVPAAAVSGRKTTAQCYRSLVPAPDFGAEWGVVAWCAGGLDSAYGAQYWRNIQKTVRNCGGVLDERKNTEYSRVILAVTAAGQNAANVAGYDLTAPLADVDATTKQGVNGAAFALLALDCGGYASNVRQSYVDYLLGQQKADGGWALSGDNGDADVTAMVLQALAAYQKQGDVATAIKGGLERLSKLQKADGCFASYGVSNCESCAQVILTLCQLGIGLDDARFVKEKRTVLDAMNSFRLSDGGYCHQAEGAVSGKATEQALLALTALQRIEDGLPGVYTMSSCYALYTDIAGHWAQKEIETAARLGLFHSEGRFRPDESMTRAELVAALWQSADAPSASGTSYSDVSASATYRTATIWAKNAGVMNGTSDTTFAPNKTLTRAELATALWRMAGKPSVSGAASALKKFTDAGQVPGWATTAMSWAVKTGLMKGSTTTTLAPADVLSRAQAATMLVRYLEMSK